jgi:hypothetical protein
MAAGGNIMGQRWTMSRPGGQAITVIVGTVTKYARRVSTLAR